MSSKDEEPPPENNQYDSLSKEFRDLIEMWEDEGFLTPVFSFILRRMRNNTATPEMLEEFPRQMRIHRKAYGMRYGNGRSFLKPKSKDGKPIDFKERHKKLLEEMAKIGLGLGTDLENMADTIEEWMDMYGSQTQELTPDKQAIFDQLERIRRLNLPRDQRIPLQYAAIVNDITSNTSNKSSGIKKYGSGEPPKFCRF
jgi:hypothetical protein